MPIFSRLAQARSGYLTGQQQGQEDQQAQAEAERQRVRQDQSDFSGKAIAALNQRILQAQAQAAEQALNTPKAPAPYRPSTMEESVEYEGQLAERKAAAVAAHRPPPKAPATGRMAAPPSPTAPREQSYNNVIVTDEATGEKFFADPRTGQPVGPVRTPGGSTAREIPQSVKMQVDGIDNLLATLDVLEQAVKEHGTPVLPGKARADLKSAYTNAQIQYKEAARLGALAGPDLALVQSALADPTDRMGMLRGDVSPENVLAGLARVRAQMQGTRGKLAGRYGLPANQASAGDIDLRQQAPDPAAEEFDDLANDYQQALREGEDPAAARREYEAAVMAVARKHGKVK